MHGQADSAISELNFSLTEHIQSLVVNAVPHFEEKEGVVSLPLILPKNSLTILSRVNAISGKSLGSIIR